jgi:hypothetical protein
VIDTFEIDSGFNKRSAVRRTLEDHGVHWEEQWRLLSSVFVVTTVTSLQKTLLRRVLIDDLGFLDREM